MAPLSIGQEAPPFRLPSGQGPEVGLDDFVGRTHPILFFAKGMACGFCRQQMSQLARAASQFRTLDAEIVAITPTPLERGRLYARRFALPFPHLCDPDYAVVRAYGLERRARPLGWSALRLCYGMTTPVPQSGLEAPPADRGRRPAAPEDDDLGFFIVDRDGLVRFAHGAPYVRIGGGAMTVGSIPATDEIVRVLPRCRMETERRPEAGQG
jgi:peroxiredoxin